MKHKISKVFFVIVMLLVLSLLAVACNDSQGNETDSDKYAVTYVGGAGATGTAPSGGEYAEGAKITLPDAGELTKADHTFGGWSYDGKTYAAGAEFTMPAKAVEFTAVWTLNQGGGEEQPDTYTITYNINGATGTVPTENAKTEGAKFNVAEATGLAKEDCVFGGWSYDGKTYAAGSEFTMPDKSVVFTAIWNKLTYTVTFNPNNSDDPVTWTETVEIGDKVVKPATDPTIDNGKVFRYWIEEETELVYNFDRAIIKNITLVASYAYKASFSAGEGTGTIEPIWINMWRPNAVTLPDGTGLSNGDKVFDGWTDGTDNYKAGDGYGAFGMKSNPTFTAVWKDASTTPVDGYTLQFGADASQATGVAPEPQNKQAGDIVTLPENTWFYSTIQGYEFKGWYIEGQYNGKTYQPGETYTMPAKNVKFLARWGTKTFTVTYKAGEHATGDDVVQEKDQNSNISLKSLEELNNPFTVNTDQNYVFAGWKREGDTSDQIYYAGDEYALNANVVFVAQWQVATEIGFYDDSYMAILVLSLSGDVGSGKIEIYTDNDKYDKVKFTYEINAEQITITLENSDSFVGTFIDNQLSISISYKGTTYKFSPEEEAPSEPVVTFDSNGGTGSEPTVTLTESGDYYRLNMPDNTFVAPENMVFKAWIIIVNGSEKGEYKPGKTFLIAAGENVVLKAIWELAEEPTIEGITYVGSCTTPVKTMYGQTLGGETFIKFVIDFEGLTLTYTTSDGVENTVKLAEGGNPGYMPNIYGSDAIYFEEITLVSAKYAILVKADKSVIMLCDTDDEPLDNGEFNMGNGGDAKLEFVSVALKDFKDKAFVAETPFYNTYLSVRIAWNSNYGYTFRLLADPSKTTGGRICYQDGAANADQVGVSFTAENSQSYDRITVKFIENGGAYQLVITSILVGGTEELLTEPVILSEYVA